MSELIILTVVAAVFVAALVVTRLAVNADGYGRLRPPASHRPDPFDARSPGISQR